MSESYWSVYYECPMCWAGQWVRVTDNLHPERYPCPCGKEAVLQTAKSYTEIADMGDWFAIWKERNESL
jgi:hypothetical protein